jgi:hypothetical protein
LRRIAQNKLREENRRKRKLMALSEESKRKREADDFTFIGGKKHPSPADVTNARTQTDVSDNPSFDAHMNQNNDQFLSEIQPTQWVMYEQHVWKPNETFSAGRTR